MRAGAAKIRPGGIKGRVEATTGVAEAVAVTAGAARVAGATAALLTALEANRVAEADESPKNESVRAAAATKRERQIMS
jgi:hypothetical protein